MTICRKPSLTITEFQQIIKSSPDPFKIVEKDILSLSGCIKELIGSDHPVLESCAK